MQIHSIPPAAKAVSGYIYLIGSRKFGWYKIGKSKDFSIRVVTLGVLLPFKIEIIAIWRTSNITLSESLMHERYAKKRINGEWFLFTHDEMVNMVKLCQPFDMALSSATENFSNIVKDVVIGEDAARLKEQKRAKGLAFMSAVEEYMEQNNMPDTKANKKIARNEILKKYMPTVSPGVDFLERKGYFGE